MGMMYWIRGDNSIDLMYMMRVDERHTFQKILSSVILKKSFKLVSCTTSWLKLFPSGGAVVHDKHPLLTIHAKTQWLTSINKVYWRRWNVNVAVKVNGHEQTAPEQLNRHEYVIPQELRFSLGYSANIQGAKARSREGALSELCSPFFKGRQLRIHYTNCEWSFSKKRTSVTLITTTRMAWLERKWDLMTKT